MNNHFYVIRIAGKLFVANPMFQTTTKNVMEAKMFQSYEDARRTASKYYNAEVIQYKVVPAEDPEGEDSQALKAAVRALGKELAEIEKAFQEKAEEADALRKAILTNKV